MIQFCKIGATLLTSSYCPLVVHHGKWNTHRRKQTWLVSFQILFNLGKSWVNRPFQNKSEEHAGVARAMFCCVFCSKGNWDSPETLTKFGSTHGYENTSRFKATWIDLAHSTSSKWLHVYRSVWRKILSNCHKTHTFAVAIYIKIYTHINVDWRTTGAASYQVNTRAESRYPLSGFWLLLTLRVLIQLKTVEKLMFHAYLLMFLPMSLCYVLRLWRRIWGNDIHPCLRLYNVQSAWFVSLLGLFAGWALVIAKTSSALQHHVSEMAG